MSDPDQDETLDVLRFHFETEGESSHSPGSGLKLGHSTGLKLGQESDVQGLDIGIVCAILCVSCMPLFLIGIINFTVFFQAVQEGNSTISVQTGQSLVEELGVSLT